MKILAIFVVITLFLSTQAILFPQVRDKTTCSKNIHKMRESYQNADNYAKQILSKSAHDDLKRLHPESKERIISLFLTGAMFNYALNDDQVCDAYYAMFLPKTYKYSALKKNDLFRCIYDCLSEKFSFQEILRIAGICMNEDEPLPCFAREVGEHLFECVSGCYGKKKQEKKNSIIKPVSVNNTAEKKDEKKCVEKVKKVRVHFNGLGRKEKIEFAKKAAKKLNEKYPNSERKVKVFLVVLLKKELPAPAVCRLYKRLFKSGKLVNDNPWDCVVECLGRFLTPENVLRIITTCGTDVSCYFEELQGPVLECAGDCFGVKKQKVASSASTVKNVESESKDECAEKVKKVRAHFKGLDRAGKKEFVKKVYKKLTEKYPDVDRKKVAAFIGALLFRPVPAPRVCQLYKRIFKSEITTSFQAVPKKDEDECPKKVKKVREHFKGLDRAGKKEFVKKVFKKLTEKYPDVDRKKVAAFIGALLFQPVPAPRVCQLYKRIFKSEKSTPVKNVTPFQAPTKNGNIVRCIYGCMRRHLDADEILRIVMECKTDVKCYLKELKEPALGCAKECTGNKASPKKDEGECPKKVKKVREHFKGLDRAGKKEFVKKVYKKLTEKYPDVDRKKVAAFIGALLFQPVPAPRVCQLYKRIFKSEKTTSFQAVPKKDEDECPKKVKKVREHFKGLDRAEKKEFVKKVFKKLTEKYPDVDRKKVAAFIGALLFQPVPAPRVCQLYKRIFKSEQKKQQVDLKNVDPAKMKCLVKCVKEHLTREEIMEVFKKCQLDRQCYLNEIISRSKKCASRCL